MRDRDAVNGGYRLRLPTDQARVLARPLVFCDAHVSDVLVTVGTMDTIAPLTSQYREYVALSFAQRIIRARLLLGAWADEPRDVTYPEMALALDVTPGAVGHWEEGRTTPSRANAENLAKVLGVQLLWLERGVGPMYADESDRPSVQPPPKVPAKKAVKREVLRRPKHSGRAAHPRAEKDAPPPAPRGKAGGQSR
jgi:transcriptional regulator with XRE-family HTH domain